jgi:Secretion system C-terminal sorting domain
MFRKLFALIIALPVIGFAQQSLVTHWDFNSLLNDANAATGTNAPLSGLGSFDVVNGATSSFATGYTGTVLPTEANTTDNSGFNATGWPAQGTGSKTRGVQINANTTGYSRIGISFWQRLSNTAPNTWVLQYTLDHTGATTGGTVVWVDTTTFTFTPQATGTGDTWHFRSVSFAANSNFNNKPNLAFRVVAAFDPVTGTYLAARSTSTYSTTGTSRFDLVRVFEAPVDVSIAAASNFFAVNENVGTIQVPITVSNANQAPVTVNLGFSTYHNATVNDDFTWTGTLTVPAASNGVVNLPIQINDDLLPEKAERIVVKLLNSDNATASLTNNYSIIFIKDNDYLAPTPSNELNLQLLSSFSNGVTGTNSAEIVAFDPSTDRLYIANSIGQKMDVVNFSNPAAPTLITSISMAPYGGINSIVAKNGIVAAAVENTNAQLNGSVVFFDQNGVFQNQVTVGAMPDMITFNQDYTKILTANEGEPNASYSADPEGSVSIINISGGIAALNQSNVTNISLSQFNGQEVALRAQGIRIFTSSASVAQDLEPEYIAVSTDNTKAYVTLQENNALLTIDLLTNTIVSLTPFGYSSYASGSNNALDASDQSGMVLITGDLPIKGAYMPDAMTYKTINGLGYLFTANEGDSREFGSVIDANRISSTTFTFLDSTAFPNQAILKNNKFLGRLSALKYSGDTDGDGDYDELHVMSGRSFSIWNATTGAQVFDSKDLIEQIIANHPTFSTLFNASNTVGTPALKNRSDDKGPEVEGIATHSFNGHHYVFASLERIGGVMIFNIDNPAAPIYVGYANNRSASNPNGPDLGAEGIIVIDAQDSPNGQHLVLLANEVSSTLSIYQMNSCAVASGAIISSNLSAICAGQNATLSVSAVPNVSYQWFANGQAMSGATSTSIQANTAGSYKVAVQNSALGCTDTSAVFSLVVNPLPSVNAGVDQSVCSGQAVGLMASGTATNYIWNNGQSGTQLTIATQGFVGTNTYTVTGTNTTTGCQAQDAVQLTVNALPQTAAGQDMTLCLGDSLLLNATGATTYTWSNGAANGAYLAPSLGTLSLVVTGTNTSGCSSVDTLIVVVNDLPALALAPQFEACSNNLPILISASASNVSYAWSTGAFSNAIEVSNPGVIDLTVTDLITGCVNTTATQINILPIPTLAQDTTVGVCSANLPYSISANASGASLSYAWSNGQTSDFLTGSIAGTFELVVEDANGCQNSGTFQVSILNSPVVNAGQDQIVCEDQFPITIAASGSAQSISWNTGSSSAILSITQPGIYILTGINGNGCFATDSIEITADPCAGLGNEVENLAVYPNPSNALVYLTFDGEFEELTLLNTEGKILEQHHQVASPFALDLSSYPSGVYLLQSRNNAQGIFQRIVKL